MFEGGYRNRKRITVPNKGYGVAIMPEPVNKHLKGHPCYGCVFTFNASKPSCLTGSYPDTENCPNAFYKELQKQHRAEYEERLRQTESKNNERQGI